MPRPRRRHVFHAVTFVVGAVALAIMIDRLGRDGFATAILGAGRWLIAIAAIDLASLVCDAAAVSVFVRRFASIRYRRVFVAQASGLAINRLTPGNSLGEPVKVTMLMAHVPEAAAVSAIVMFNVATYVVAVAAIAIGVPVTLVLLDLPPTAELVVIVLTVALVAAIVGLVILARRGALATLLRAGRRIRLVSAERARRWELRLADIDANVRTFGGGATWRALGFATASRLLNMAGGLAILIATDTELTAPLVVGTLSVGILITWISNIVPLGLGLAEGGTYALYGALGATPGAGLEFAMINRVRTVVLASLGLAVMAIANLIGRRAPR